MTSPPNDIDPPDPRLAQLRDGPVPPASLENRVVASLARADRLRAGSRDRRRWARVALGAAAAALIFWAGRQTAAVPEATGDDGSTPRWMLLLYEDARFDAGAPGQHAAEYGRWAATTRTPGRAVGGGELPGDGVLIDPATPSAVPTRLDRSDLGRLAGYFLIAAPSLDAAAALARTNPHLTHRGRIVIRRIGAS